MSPPIFSEIPIESENSYTHAKLKKKKLNIEPVVVVADRRVTRRVTQICLYFII